MDSAPTRRTYAAYILLLLATLGAFFAIRHLGAGLTAPPPRQAHFGTPASAAGADVLRHVILALALVIVSARLMGALFRRFGQPPVIGEVVAGIMLGPSLLGRVWPAAGAYVLPPTVAPFLNVVAQLGVMLYMFIVGLELDTDFVRRRSEAAVSISHASIVLPFILGAGLSLLLYPMFSTSDVPFTLFALFMGTAMSVTAFPVLARILTDRGLHRSVLGTIAITCAAVDDVTAWSLLALVVSLAKARLQDAVVTVALSLAFVGFVLVVVRGRLRGLARRVEGQADLGSGPMAAVLVVVLFAAFTTEWIGIHALFGAFLVGAVIPHDSTLARALVGRLHDVVVVLLLPAFFAFTGMRTQIGLVQGLGQWLICGLIVLVASVGKFGGSFIAARLSGFGSREAAGLGVLMNTRGLMELIVLNIGLDLGVISPTLFAMLVLMALVTTMATTPVFDRLVGVGQAPRT